MLQAPSVGSRSSSSSGMSRLASINASQIGGARRAAQPRGGGCLLGRRAVLGAAAPGPVIPGALRPARPGSLCPSRVRALRASLFVPVSDQKVSFPYQDSTRNTTGEQGVERGELRGVTGAMSNRRLLATRLLPSAAVQVSSNGLQMDMASARCSKASSPAPWARTCVPCVSMVAASRVWWAVNGRRAVSPVRHG